MNPRTKILLISIVLFSAILRPHAQEAVSPASPPTKYRMQLVYIFEAESTEFVFVIGNVGFKSLASLKRFLSTLPHDSTLEWAPGCRRTGGEPLLSSEQEMEEFKEFCKANLIDFILIPSG